MNTTFTCLTTSKTMGKTNSDLGNSSCHIYPDHLSLAFVDMTKHLVQKACMAIYNYTLFLCISHAGVDIHRQESNNPSLHTTNKHKWWQNGTRCRDDVEVLWCHSHLVWLIFEASIPTCACFSFRKLFVPCILCSHAVDRHFTGKRAQE